MQTKNQATQITPRQLEVLQTIGRFEVRQCYSATIAELAAQLNLSRTTVFEHIAELRKKRLLTASQGRARSSRLTARANRLLEKAATLDTEDQSRPQDWRRAGPIPFVGKVAAGVPTEAIENVEMISLRSMFGDGDDIFILQVTGDSMIDEGICEGDYVLCRKSTTAANGQIVVAIIDEQEATLKRFYKEPDCVRLEAANMNYEPIYTRNCRIEAEVLGLLRRL